MSKQIVLGKADGHNVTLDVDVVLKTRLLIQGGSGSGKSWLLRRIAEQLFGHLPVIIIDPEGEFATLRESFGYVLVGQGGETPADIRSAGLVAHKLLELKASAVCDLYEMKPADRHEWVKRFLEALIDAPKTLWTKLVVIVDEAHMFCPEKGEGESAATEAMIALTSRGRKRGFGSMFATQRLAKLRKDTAAELQNVLIGRTFIDVDRKRAIETLGVAKDEAKAFSHDLKTLKEGHFWAFGAAIALERELTHIGPVQTSHPKLGVSSKGAPPPAPDKVKALLPQLADLPQEAEKKALTEKELRQQLAASTADTRRLTRELEQAKVAPGATKRPDVPVLTDADRALLEKVAGKVDDVAAALLSSVPVDHLRAVMVQALERAVDDLTERQASSRTDFLAALDGKRLQKVREKLEALKSAASQNPAHTIARLSTHRNESRGQSSDVPARQPGRVNNQAQTASEGDSTISGVGQRILNALAELEALGSRAPQRELVALLAGYTHLQSKGFVNAMSALRSAGLIDYPNADGVLLTDEGQAAAIYPDRPRTAREVQDRLVQILGGKSAEILRPLIEAYPQSLPRADVAAAAGYGHLQSKGFVNAVSRLSSLGFIVYPDRSTIAAAPVLFLDAA